MSDNEKAIARAHLVLSTTPSFAEDQETNLADLLADLRLWAASKGVDFDNALDRSAIYADEEAALTDQQKEDLAEVMGAAEKWADELAGDMAFEAEMDGDEDTGSGYRDAAKSIQQAASRLALSMNPTGCEWFGTCENLAVTHLPHPILGAVPACQRCADKVARLEAL